MNLSELLRVVSESGNEDWSLIFRPTFRHRFQEILNSEGALATIDHDEHLVCFTYKPNIEITMAYGLVERGSVILPPENPFASENARTVYLDIFVMGRLAYREVILKVDRNRCLLPLPTSWEAPIMVPMPQVKLVRLLHALAGPPTDFDRYFEESGMRQADLPWP